MHRQTAPPFDLAPPAATAGPNAASWSLLARRLRRATLVVALVVFGLSVPAYAATYWTVPAVLKSFFSTSKRVTYKQITLPDATAAELAKKLGTPVKKTWTIYVAETEGRRDGFAIVDDEMGMHEPIDYAVRYTDLGTVDRIEILVYREAYGDEIRGERFRAQFRGKTAKDPITAGKDIDIVSGASISSRSIATGVRRDTLVLEAALARGGL